MAYCEDCRQRLSLSRRFFAAPQSGQSPDRENEEQGKDEEAQRASEHVTNNVLI
jgi:hypothetical protein